MTIRTGNHPDHGRVVFDAPSHIPYRVVQNGDRLTVVFSSPGSNDVAVTGNPVPPRNVAALHADGNEVTLTITDGSTFHDARIGDHVVIDVFDPPVPGPHLPDAEGAPPQRSAPGGQPSLAVHVAPSAVVHAAPSAATHAAPSAATHAAPSAATHTAPSEATHAAATPPDATPPPAQVAANTGPTQSSPVAEPPSLLPPPPPVPSPDPPQDAGRFAVASPTQSAAPAAAALPPAVGSAAPAPSQAAASNSSPPPATATDDMQPAQPLEPPALQARPVPLPPDTPGAAFSLPLPADIAAAVFRRHDETLVVFDERHAIDMSGVNATPPFTSARVDLLPAATLIHLTPPPGTAVILSRTSEGWTVAVLPAAGSPQPVTPEFGDTSVGLPAGAPGSVVVLADPLTGGTLLVGTQRQPGQGMFAADRTPQFTLLPTTQGVVVAPLADTVALRAVPNGFVLRHRTGPAGGLASRHGDARAMSPP